MTKSVRPLSYERRHKMKEVDLCSTFLRKLNSHLPKASLWGSFLWTLMRPVFTLLTVMSGSHQRMSGYLDFSKCLHLLSAWFALRICSHILELPLFSVFHLCQPQLLSPIACVFLFLEKKTLIGGLLTVLEAWLSWWKADRHVAVAAAESHIP